MTDLLCTPDLMAAHILTSITQKCIAVMNHTAFQRRCHCDRLCGGTWLISITDTEITPQLIELIQPFFLCHGIGFFLCGDSICHQIIRLVQIIFPIACHGKDLSCIGIHHNGCCRLTSSFSLTEIVRIFFLEIIDRFFHDLLQCHINRGHDRISIHSCTDIFLLLQVFIQIIVGTPVLTIQCIRILLLDSVLSHISGYRVSDHVTCQRIIRIPSDIGIFQPHAFDPAVLIIHCFFKILHFRFGQLLFQHDIMTVLFFLHDRIQFAPVQIEVLHQRT